MDDLSKTYSKLTFINNNVDTIAVDALRMSSDLAVKLQQSQMLLGLDSDGKKIGTYRNKQYKSMKQGMNPQAGGMVDLKLTGAFQNGIRQDINSETWTMRSTDEKAGELTEKYGSRIWGFAPKSKQVLDEKINHNFNIQIKKII